ncbi:MAG: cytochrome C [Chloroflexi bacterium]|nr:cytochrome C [Chloroflexota bacterium]
MAFRLSVSLAVSGAATGALATALDAWGGINPPRAYGFCMTCHSRDLVDWVANQLFATHWEVALPGVQFPILTVVGVLLGAYVACILASERRLRPAAHPWLSLVAGVLVVNFGLVALGCPTRQVVRLGYGDWTALTAVAGIVLGAGLGTLVLKRRA